MILTVIFPFELVILCMVLHELGHYTMARILGRKPWFEFGVMFGMPAICAKSEKIFEIGSGGDLKRAIREEALIAQAGILSIVIPLILMYLFPDIWLVFFILMFPFTVYTVWEVGSSINKCEIENLED